MGNQNQSNLSRQDAGRAVDPVVDGVKRRFMVVGNSPQLVGAIERAVKVAPIDLSVLVHGESGSGKEFFPKIIHQYGARKHKKYIAVNCGAIPEGTIDSELFGHEKGSFTGAINDRKGYFEEADGGTVFLDEVAELPLTTQARLLRVLETGEFLKVGSSKVQKTDVRIVAATNVDLLEAVAAGRFREDLYYRLSTVVIEVPNLHDRGADILLLARKFASDFSEKYMTEPITFSEEARRLMSLYRWPGNVRQLKNVVEQLAIFQAGEEIGKDSLLELLPLSHGRQSQLTAPGPRHDYETERELLWQTILTLKNQIEELRRSANLRDCEGAEEVTDGREPLSVRSMVKYGGDGTSLLKHMESEPEAPVTLEESEKQLMESALERNGGNRRRTAEELNISERTLYRKIREFGLEGTSK